MTMRTARQLVLAGVLAVWASETHAECIRTLETIAERFARTPLVFLGEVLKVETVILDPEPFVYRVRFKVDESFKGTTGGEQTFDFGATAEDFIFKEGQRVLVWAPRNERGKFSTQCTDTRSAKPDDPVVTELRTLSGR
jgi:hypothetical protein